MREIEGNLVKLAKDSKFDYIVHGCNCFGDMTKGIAKDIALAFPDAVKADNYKAFKGLHPIPKGDYNRLGTISVAHEKVFLERKYNNLKIVNIYSQFEPGPNLDYEALALGLRKLKHYIKLHETNKTIKVGLPKIGAGAYGGDWEKIKPIIAKELEGLDVTIVYLKI